jgi:hypothetical protein
MIPVPGYMLLKLRVRYDGPLANFSFIDNLRRYILLKQRVRYVGPLANFAFDVNLRRYNAAMLFAARVHGGARARHRGAPAPRAPASTLHLNCQPLQLWPQLWIWQMTAPVTAVDGTRSCGFIPGALS